MEGSPSQIHQILLQDNLERVHKDVSLVWILKEMAKRQDISPGILARRLICEAPAFRAEMARRMRGEE